MAGKLATSGEIIDLGKRMTTYSETTAYGVHANMKQSDIMNAMREVLDSP